MKIKKSFVTNSSSTSFIIVANSESLFDIERIKETRFNEMVKKLEDFFIDLLFYENIDESDREKYSDVVKQYLKIVPGHSRDDVYFIRLLFGNRLNPKFDDNDHDPELIRYMSYDLLISSIQYYDYEEILEEYSFNKISVSIDCKSSIYPYMRDNMELDVENDTKKILEFFKNFFGLKDSDNKTIYLQNLEYFGDGWNGMDTSDLSYSFDLFQKFAKISEFKI